MMPEFGSDDLSSGANEVSIQIADRKIVGWKTVSISRSAESFPNAFQFTCADQFPYDAARAIVLPGGQAGEPCRVYIGSDLVITGYVDRYAVQTGPNQHDVVISGRGLCQDLYDCSIDPTKPPVLGGTIKAANMLDLAQKLCANAGIAVRSEVADTGKPLHAMQFFLGESAYEVLEKVARYAQFLLYEDETGALVLDRVGTKKMASGFQMPGNVESANSTLSIDQRFSRYLVVWTTVTQFGEISPLSNNQAHAEDTTMPRDRLRIIVSEQIEPGENLGQQRADWEKARRIGRSQAINLTCDSWRDSAGTLWQPNRLAKIDMPAHKLVNAEWIIGGVVFRKDHSGTHADLVLMPPDAFSVQPGPLLLWDREVVDAVANSQDPAPPSTDTLPPGATPPT